MTAVGQYVVHVDDSFDPPVARIEGLVGPPLYKVVAWRRDLIALKVPGHHYYGGLGQPQSYAPAAWWVLRVLELNDDGSLLCAEGLKWPWRS